ncbi:MAG: DUF2397 family protein [Candidatus Hatepunaea meridiana]|nr:DUF2397 family protein [Candidatus Hatepunaea meridiana]
MATNGKNNHPYSPEPANQGQEDAKGVDHGEVTDLVSQRNRALGHLLTAERAFYYVQILFSLLRFRRAHELEPLHEDLYEDIYKDLNALNEDAEYDLAHFNSDIHQLKNWNLIGERIELERLRGYQDTRRKKYRYSLSSETRAFLEWLEDRARDDLEESGADTRNQLETILSGLRELKRVLYRVGTKRSEDGDARRVLYQLATVNELTHTITGNLISFDERMYGFLMTDFALDKAKQILDELRVFVEEFLSQIYNLRDDIVKILSGIGSEQSREKIRVCLEQMEEERKRSAHLLRRSFNAAQMEATPGRLIGFYGENGRLDQLCRRISRTAQQVWRRLYLRLRERERKSHRLLDLRQRIKEVALLEPEEVPYNFLFELISPAQISVDPNYWTEREKASPPQPRMYKGRQREHAIEPLGRKKRNPETARALEQQQLGQLIQWLREKIIMDNEMKAQITAQKFDGFDDLEKTMQIIKAGKLSKGKKLVNTGFWLLDLEGWDALEAENYALEMKPLVINRGTDNGN